MDLWRDLVTTDRRQKLKITILIIWLANIYMYIQIETDISGHFPSIFL